MLGLSYLKKIFRRSASGKTSTEASRKAVNDETDNEMAMEMLSYNKDHRSSATKSRSEHSVRQNIGKTIPLPNQDLDNARSKILGKRKREDRPENADGRTEVKEQSAPEQDKECTVCLEVVAKTSFPDTKHSADHEHSSDVCLSCWNQHIESEIRSKSFEGISCLQCPYKLGEEEVHRLTNESTYAEYAFLPTPIRTSMLTCTPDISTKAPRAACSRMKSSGPALVPTAPGVCICDRCQSWWLRRC